MGKKKIQTILAMSAMVGTAPIVAHHTTQQNNIVLENNNISNNSDKANNANNKQTSNINSNNINDGNQKVTNDKNNTNVDLAAKSPDTKEDASSINYAKDLAIQVTNVSMSKITSAGTTDNTEYQPDTKIPSTGNIVTTGTIVNYQISVSLRSRTGKLYPVSSAYLTASPIVSYIDKAGNSEQEKQAEQELMQSINTQLGKLTNLNSTSTFTITASFNIGNADWNATIKPNITLHITAPDGKDLSVPVDTGDLRETNKYYEQISALPKLSDDEGNQHSHTLSVAFASGNNSSSPGIYNPKNKKLQSITFKINNPDPENIKITPLTNVPGFKVNPNGTYTVTGKDISNYQKLFNVTTTTNKSLREDITVTPVSSTFTDNVPGVDTNTATVLNYAPGKALLSQRDLGSLFTMTQSSIPGQSMQKGIYVNNNKVTYRTRMTSGVPGKYKIYTGSLVTNGQIMVSDKNATWPLINNGDVYCHLDNNAVDILKGGTPEQKAQIMSDIISGNMSGIGTEYTASELQKILNSGEKLPILNFVYTSKEYDGNNFSSSSVYYTAPLEGNYFPVVSRTITYGKLEGTYTPEQESNMISELKNGQLPSDGVITKDGKLQGFILTPPNIYNNAMMTGQITDERYGDYSHGLSAEINIGMAQTGTTIGNIGQLGSNSASTVTYGWLTQPHQVNALIQGMSNGAPLQFDNSQIVVNMGHTFKITGPVQLAGLILPEADYKIDGDKLVINVPKKWGMTLGDAPDVQFTSTYTNPQTLPDSITLSTEISGPDASKGMNYHYNNQVIPAQQGGMPAIQNYKTVIAISKTISNDCIHSVTMLQNGDAQLKDIVINNNEITKTYYIAGEIPTTGSNNLPGNDGEPSTGNLSTELQTLNTNGVPTWVLPKSALNAENESILTSPTGSDLGDKLKYIESPESGWVKYTPGMNLSNMVGYFTTPTVGPREAFTMTYNVKLKQGANPEGLPEVVNSAFKYYDATDKIGSTSNIVNITPPGVNISNSWISTVKEVGGGTLTTDDLNKTVTVDGKTVKLKDLIGTGPDVDSNYDNTPTKLMNEVTLSQDAEVLKKLGYKLVNITVNGKVRDLNWFENTGIVNNSGLTEVVFNIQPLVSQATTTVKEQYSNGKPVVADKVTTNDINSKVDTSLPELPKGYQVTSITVNGKTVDKNEVPITQGKDNQTIIYTIGKQPTDTVNVVYEDGKPAEPSVSVTGNTGDKTGLNVPKIPEGYHVVKVTNTTKGVDGVPKTFGDTDNTTTYTIAKNVKDKTYAKVVTTNGTVLVPSKEIGSGAPNSKEDVITPTVPQGYKITKVTVN